MSSGIGKLTYSGIGICVIAASATWLAGRPIFEPLGHLHPDFVYSQADAVSHDGSVIVGHTESELSYNEAFRWVDGVMTGLGDLPGGVTMSRANAVSGDGSVITGVSDSDAGMEAFRWEGDTMTGLGFLDTDSTWGSDATAMTTVGGNEIIVGEADDPRVTEQGFAYHYTYAVRWYNQSIASLDIPVNEYGNFIASGMRAEDISRDGSIIVGSLNIMHAFWSDGEQVVDIHNSQNPFPLYTSTKAFGVSGDGSVLVGQALSNSPTINWAGFAYHRTEKLFVPLPFLNPEYTLASANDISGDGTIIVGFSTISLWPNTTDREAVFWTNPDGAGWQPVSLNAWADDHGVDRADFRMEEARAISDDGSTIVGWGRNSNGQHEAFRLNISGVTGWAGWPAAGDNGDVETGDFLHRINTTHAPWIYVYRMNAWVYCPESHVSEAGAWMYSGK